MVKAIDLGLSVMWSDRNIGSNSPEDQGYFFAWGETEPKSSFGYDNYMCSGRECGTDADPIVSASLEDISGTKFDAATVNLGDGWRMPTLLEIKELLNKCSWQWIERDGVLGYNVTGRNGNSIFLPAAGRRMGDALNDVGVFGRYWSSVINDYSYESADGLDFSVSNHEWSYGSRCFGRVIRAVKKNNQNQPQVPIFCDRTTLRDLIKRLFSLQEKLAFEYVLKRNPNAKQASLIVTSFECPLFHAWEHFGHGQANEFYYDLDASGQQAITNFYNRYLQDPLKTLIFDQRLLANGNNPFNRIFDDAEIVKQKLNAILNAMVSELEHNG